MPSIPLDHKFKIVCLLPTLSDCVKRIICHSERSEESQNSIRFFIRLRRIQNDMLTFYVFTQSVSMGTFRSQVPNLTSHIYLIAWFLIIFVMSYGAGSPPKYV